MIEHATGTARGCWGSTTGGQGSEGFVADLLVVNGNPLGQPQSVNPYGTDVMVVNGKPVSNYTALRERFYVEVIRGRRIGGGNGRSRTCIPYYVPTLNSLDS